jgi:hypothetical protein
MPVRRDRLPLRFLSRYKAGMNIVRLDYSVFSGQAD